MTNSDKASRQNRTTQIRVLGESLVESNEVKVRSDREGGQVSVAPNVCRECSQLSEVSPSDLNIVWLVGECDAFVGHHLIVHLPRVAHGKRVARENLAIRRQSEKTHLSNSAKTTTLLGRRVHPYLGRNVMRVRVKGKCNPEVDIRKMHSTHVSPPRHLPRQESPECVRSSSERSLARSTEPRETQPVVERERRESPDGCARSPSPPPLRVAQRIHREPPHRFECVLKFPCRNYRTTSGLRQAIPQLRCFAQ